MFFLFRVNKYTAFQKDLVGRKSPLPPPCPLEKKVEKVFGASLTLTFTILLAYSTGVVG